MKTIIRVLVVLMVQTQSLMAQKQELIEAHTFQMGLISIPTSTENMFSFTENSRELFFTRTLDWDIQSAFISIKKNGKYQEPKLVRPLDSIYNGAISPDGKKIIFSIKRGNIEEVWLVNRKDEGWTEPISITQTTGIEGGYFNWRTNDEIYFQLAQNNGDIARTRLEGSKFTMVEKLDDLNTDATEFSPFIDKKERFLIFTRYLEGNESQQGFFISYNYGHKENIQWSEPEKLEMLPYGWGAYVLEEKGLFLFCDGEDIKYCSIERLALKINKEKD